jgi:tRNA U34 5-carboxymethylaminomethyl modifying GTPase MnmE/TrmE
MSDNRFAQLTSSGSSAVAVFRAAGPRVAGLLRECVVARGSAGVRAAGRAFYADIRDDEGVFDDAIVLVHGPHCVELCTHGGGEVRRRLRHCLVGRGFAEVRDFDELWPSATPLLRETLTQLPRMRTSAGVAWLLAQPQQLAELIATASRGPLTPELAAACRAAARGRQVVEWFATPLRVALAGPPNAGKSTLFNRLLGRQAAIVSDVPGTTRDWIEADGEIAGFPVTWIDTAGRRDDAGELEAVGIRVGQQAALGADIVLQVLDATRIVAADGGRLTAYNKIDVPRAGPLPAGCVGISALTGEGLDELCRELLRRSGRGAAGVAATTDNIAKALERLALGEPDETLKLLS